jgi:uncharacterized protein (DUF433 family)
LPSARSPTRSTDDGEQKASLASVITIGKDILHSIPCFTGSRVPVQTLIDFLESDDSIDDFLAIYPVIPRKQILAFLALSRDITLEQLPCGSLSTTATTLRERSV